MKIINEIKKFFSQLICNKNIGCKSLDITLTLLIIVFILIVIINHFKLSQLLQTHLQKNQNDDDDDDDDEKMKKITMNSSKCYKSKTKTKSCPVGSYKQCTNNVLPKKKCDCTNQRANIVCK